MCFVSRETYFSSGFYLYGNHFYDLRFDPFYEMSILVQYKQRDCLRKIDKRSRIDTKFKNENSC